MLSIKLFSHCDYSIGLFVKWVRYSYYRSHLPDLVKIPSLDDLARGLQNNSRTTHAFKWSSNSEVTYPQDIKTSIKIEVKVTSLI